MEFLWIIALAVVWFVLVARIYRKQRAVGLALLGVGILFCLLLAGYIFGKARALEDNAHLAAQVAPSALLQDR